MPFSRFKQRPNLSIHSLTNCVVADTEVQDNNSTTSVQMLIEVALTDSELKGNIQNKLNAYRDLLSSGKVFKSNA
jgi:ABC-type phosphate transport system ATPase subunit